MKGRALTGVGSGVTKVDGRGFISSYDVCVCVCVWCAMCECVCACVCLRVRYTCTCHTYVTQYYSVQHTLSMVDTLSASIVVSCIEGTGAHPMTNK